MYICYCPLRDPNWNKKYCIVLYCIVLLFMLYVGQRLIRAYICMLVKTMPTLDKIYLFIYLFIYSASSLSKMAADSVLSYKPRFAN